MAPTGYAPAPFRGFPRSRGSTVGAGVEYCVNPRLALDLGVTYSGGRFEQNPSTNLRGGFMASRVQVGFHLRP